VIQPNFTEDEDIDPAQLYSGEYDESGRFIKDEEKAAEAALANEELEKNAAAAAEAEGQVVATVTVPAPTETEAAPETPAPEADNN